MGALDVAVIVLALLTVAWIADDVRTRCRRRAGRRRRAREIEAARRSTPPVVSLWTELGAHEVLDAEDGTVYVSSTSGHPPPDATLWSRLVLLLGYREVVQLHEFRTDVRPWPESVRSELLRRGAGDVLSTEHDFRWLASERVLYDPARVEVVAGTCPIGAGWTPVTTHHPESTAMWWRPLVDGQGSLPLTR